MKKIMLAFLFFGLFVLQTMAQGSSTDRKELHDLIDIRRARFEAYSGSLEKKSGFFGNKTKKDMQKTMDALSEIIETDNRIISSLNHVVDFRSYQKVNTNYDMLKNNEQLSNLQHATDTLVKQLDALLLTNAKLKSKIRRFQWTGYSLLFFLLTYLFILVRKKYRKQNADA